LGHNRLVQRLMLFDKVSLTILCENHEGTKSIIFNAFK